MSGVAIYMEGGGDTVGTKDHLRRGMDLFLADLKNQARNKGWHWKLVPCGSRLEAKDKFLNARKEYPNIHAILLVDAEAPVARSPKQHLIKNPDKWNLKGVPEDVIQLMVVVMETWLVADPETLASFYGQKFNVGLLPRSQNLETVSKKRIGTALELATKHTQKGEYHKIKHASVLLARIRPEQVRARCPHCERLFTTIDALIT